ncbi:ATP-binding cassette domain-containing protein [Lapidilactobacillus luobeiensis]|uniref:ATP-binding cassette domain-containing protein n=1 Tax=Lapidilactobacillus luobeiensis TaxID=2950371 RepID=UPI0021C46CE3|nr:ATP-binding cassette domain-containing protein [Lapidilactobacillus luobeiensis]
MLELKHIIKSFADRVLFTDFSCQIEQGRFVVFSGRSGSGKTTLLNIIGGIEPVESGQVLLDGLDLTDNRQVLRAYREKLGFLFQNYALVEHKTVAENILMIAPKYRNPLSVAEVLAQVGLPGYEKKRIYTLSGGEQQRVALARLFMKKCNVVLADEPTGSLDQANTDLVMTQIMALNQAGKTIILVTHDEKIKQLGDEIIAL